MTEEMEKKLNELLGLKKQLEEITEEKKKAVTSEVFEQYKKEARLGLIRYRVAFGIGLAQYIVFVVLALSIYNNDTLKFVFIGIAILGLGVPMVAKLGLRISQSKLSILQEMKQFEMRITELLNNNP
jgi:hypothetical protein